MGNYASCALAGPTGKQSKAAKVIFPSGEIKIFQQPTKAAELMLEIPNFFLVNSRSLQIGRRFSALNADEDLEIANVYVMFPMKRVNSAVTAADMGALFLAANRGGAGAGNVKVVPACEVGEGECESPACGVEAAVEEFFSPEFQQRRSSFCRSKKPLLETIVEESVSVSVC